VDGLIEMKTKTSTGNFISVTGCMRFRVFSLLVFPLVGSWGCAPLQLPKNPFQIPSSTGGNQLSLGSRVDSSMTEAVYYAVKRAKSENGVVLQVVGDNHPVRVLPLPDDERTVYVSELLSQTGVLKALGYVEATLFRASSESISGVRMEIKMERSKDSVQPSSDYALQAGDRLMVSKAANPAIEMLLNGIVGN